MTPRELNELIEGYMWRRDTEEELAAWMCANIMNATGRTKTRITTAMLLGPKHRRGGKAKPQMSQRYWDLMVQQSNTRVQEQKEAQTNGHQRR